MSGHYKWLSPAQQSIVERFANSKYVSTCGIDAIVVQCPLHPRRRLTFVIGEDGGLIALPDHHCDINRALGAVGLVFEDLRAAL